MNNKNSVSATDFAEFLVPGKKFLFFDLEANCPADRLENSRSAISEMEIIQIGYAVFDCRFNILERKSIIVKPVMLPEISPFITSLTGISQSKADGGVPWFTAMHEFACAVQACEYAVSWGSYDHLQLADEFKRNGIPEDYGFSRKLLNGKELVSEKTMSKPMSMDRQVRALGLSFE